MLIESAQSSYLDMNRVVKNFAVDFGEQNLNVTMLKLDVLINERSQKEINRRGTIWSKSLIRGM